MYEIRDEALKTVSEIASDKIPSPTETFTIRKSSRLANLPKVNYKESRYSKRFTHVKNRDRKRREAALVVAAEQVQAYKQVLESTSMTIDGSSRQLIGETAETITANPNVVEEMTDAELNMSLMNIWGLLGSVAPFTPVLKNVIRRLRIFTSKAVQVIPLNRPRDYYTDLLRRDISKIQDNFAKNKFF